MCSETWLLFSSLSFASSGKLEQLLLDLFVSGKDFFFFLRSSHLRFAQTSRICFRYLLGDILILPFEEVVCLRGCSSVSFILYLGDRRANGHIQRAGACDFGERLKRLTAETKAFGSCQLRRTVQLLMYLRRRPRWGGLPTQKSGPLTSTFACDRHRYSLLLGLCIACIWKEH